MNAAAEQTPSLQREWWLRALAVIQSPGAVFTAMRDDSDEAAGARAEPLTAIVLLAGMAGVLSASVAGRLLDQLDLDRLAVLIWAFLGGGAYGLLVFWLGGAFLRVAWRRLGGAGSYRQARHVLGFAAAPLALSLLLVWPIRVTLYRSDLFRSGGADTGIGDRLFEGLAVLAFLWALALVVVGVRALHDWSWGRAGAAVGIASVIPALLVLASAL